MNRANGKSRKMVKLVTTPDLYEGQAPDAEQVRAPALDATACAELAGAAAPVARGTVRNDLSRIKKETTIPVCLGEFSCGCWGRHQPPRVIDGTVVFDVGVGYRSNKHLHGQNAYVLDVVENMALVELRKFGDMFGAGLWHYLVGIDQGTPWIAHVPKTASTVAQAVQRLMPAAVRRAQLQGEEVKRQGDFFFVPTHREPQGEILTSTALDDDHVADEMVRGKTTFHVRGCVRHGHHETLELGSIWHKAVRNNAIRTGRLGRGGDCD